MKTIFSLLFTIAVINSAFGQNIGLRTNTLLSENKEINAAIGAGLYLNIYDSLWRFEYLIFVDYLLNDKKFNNCKECATIDITRIGG